MRRNPAPDYIFQIYNRETVRNPEILVSSLCARIRRALSGQPAERARDGGGQVDHQADGAGRGVYPVPEGTVAVS